MDTDLLGRIIEVLVVLGAGGGIGGLIQSRRKIKQMAADTNLTNATVEINLSTEARELMDFWKNEVATVKAENASIKDENRDQEVKIRKLEGREDFLVNWLRQQGLQVPDYPERLNL